MFKPFQPAPWIALIALAALSAWSATADERPPDKPARPGPVFPVKVADGGRCLVDLNGAPFLIAGESPQALMVNLSEEDAELFLANRQSHGFNAVWINLLCRTGTGGRADGSTYDGLLPFEKTDDFTKPNEAYFARCDRMIRLAEKHGLLVILDPCETIDHLNPMLKNGPKACREFGRYLGGRYKRFDNLLWMHGNDFQTWKDADHDAAVQALALGIKDNDPRHLHTVELNYLVSGSRDDARWAPIIDLSAAYTYYPPYVQVLKDYNRQPVQPVVMIESDYEFEHDSTPAMLRRQEYWSLLSGAAGQLYGNGYTWPFKPGWKDKLDAPGAKQMAHVQALFGPRLASARPGPEAHGSDRRLRHVRRHDHRGQPLRDGQRLRDRGPHPGRRPGDGVPAVASDGEGGHGAAWRPRRGAVVRPEPRRLHGGRRVAAAECRRACVHPSGKQRGRGRGLGAGTGDDDAQGR